MATAETRPGTTAGPWSDVGAGLDRPATRVAALALAASILSWDFWIAGPPAARLLAGIAGLGVLSLLAGTPRAVGLVSRPRRGLRWWLVATIGAGAGVGAVALLTLAAIRVLRIDVEVPRLLGSRGEIPSFLWWACVVAPVVEEPLYRGVLCTALRPAIGPWPTVVASGLVFAALHVRYGNPGPDNAVAGFVLGWAFLKGGSLWVPVAWHALGNLGVLFAHLALLEGWVDV